MAAVATVVVAMAAAIVAVATAAAIVAVAMAAEIAVETVVGFLKQNESVRQVIFDVYTDQDLVIYQKLLEQER